VLGIHDLSLEVPQKKQRSLSSWVVWMLELEKEDIVEMTEEYAARGRIKSGSIPAYCILKEGIKWSPAHDTEE